MTDRRNEETPAELQQKVSDALDHCPYCKSTEIYYTGANNDVDPCLYRGVECKDCGKQWEEEYEFKRIVKEGELPPNSCDNKSAFFNECNTHSPEGACRNCQYGFKYDP